MRILVIDDEHEVGTTLTAVLKAAGFEAAYAANGPEAVRAFERNGADVVIVDMHMPGMDGLELIARLKRKRARTKILGISGGGPGGQGDLLKMSARLGAHATLAKPFSNAALIAKIKTLVPDA